MTQEDKELLLKDLCARLPYGVKGIRIYKPEEIVTLGEIIPRCKMNPNIGNGSFCELGFDKISDCCTITEFKPYLFSLSSMTEEQKREYNMLLTDIPTYEYEGGDIVTVFETYDNWMSIDYLNANHFDYRGLIEKGLAIDATGLNIY